MKLSIESILETLEVYMTDVMWKRRQSRFHTFLRGGLYLCSRIYFHLVRLRLWLYRHRILRDQTLGCLVISIGNLTVGGTGKTPVVEVFAKTLAERNRKVAILSRGYKSKGPSFWDWILHFLFLKPDLSKPRVVSDGKKIFLSSLEAGDEPYMLAKNLPNVVVLVDKDRVKAGQYAIKHFNCDTLILDDGFQYLLLKPRHHIVLVDASNPFANHHLLPLGFLREPIENLIRADYIFLTKSNGSPAMRHLKRFIKRHNPRAEIIECCHQPLYLQNLKTEERCPLSYLKDKKVASICGIAKPKSFEDFLYKFGANLVYFKRYADHHRYTEEEVLEFAEEAQQYGAEIILTTEKDAVRFPLPAQLQLPVFFMRVEINIISGHESFEQCIARICFSQLSNADPLEEIPHVNK